MILTQIDHKDGSKIQPEEQNFYLDSYFSKQNLGGYLPSRLSKAFNLIMPDNSLEGIGIKKGEKVFWTDLFDFIDDQKQANFCTWEDDIQPRFLYILSLSTGDLIPRIIEWDFDGNLVATVCNDFEGMVLVEGEFEIVGKVVGIR